MIKEYVVNTCNAINDVDYKFLKVKMNLCTAFLVLFCACRARGREVKYQILRNKTLKFI